MKAREVIESTYVDAWDQHIMADGADAVITALKAAGYVIVPVEPPEEMLKALRNRQNDDGRETWKAMISAVKDIL